MKILFLQKRVLFPANTGGRIRTLNVLRFLARWHDVTYLCNLQPGEAVAAEEMKALGVRLLTTPWLEAPRGGARFYCDLVANLFSRYPFNVDKDFDPALRALAGSIAAEHDLLICDFVQMARNAIGLAVPKILFTHNVEAQIFERQASHDDRRLRRRFLSLQARRMHVFEGHAGRSFDSVIAVSAADKRQFEARYGWSHVHVIDTAVDTDYFRPYDTAEQPDSLVFVGSLDWAPNEDGVRHFCGHVWPLIRDRKPDARLRIVGRNPTAAVRDLARLPGVEVIGTVPDIRPYVAEAALVIVPLRVGGGTRLKLFEAMAMRKAVVSTTLGAEGLPVVSGTDVLLADGPEDFAQAVTRLLDDRDHRRALAERAFESVARRFHAEAVARQFERICLETVATTARDAVGPSS